MLAAVRDRYGSPDVVRLEEVPTPVPTEDRILVRVRAASVNRGDLDGIYPKPQFVRLFMGLRRPRNHRVGEAFGDLNVAEPRALIGFAGPRVIQQTVRETLPEGFQRSEFLLEHGAIDLIIDRRELRPRLGNLLAQLTGKPTPKFVAAPIEPIVVPPVPANV